MKFALRIYPLLFSVVKARGSLQVYVKIGTEQAWFSWRNYKKINLSFNDFLSLSDVGNCLKALFRCLLKYGKSPCFLRCAFPEVSAQDEMGQISYMFDDKRIGEFAV